MNDPHKQGNDINTFFFASQNNLNENLRGICNILKNLTAEISCAGSGNHAKILQ